MVETSWASSEGVRRSMVANRGRDTGPELAVRRILHAEGLRYRVDFAPLGGRRRADIVFTRQRIAIFIDGCFWHGCPDHYTAPVRNGEFWADKVRSNMTRDAETTATISAAGWVVLRFWEHESAPDICDRIVESMERHPPARRPS
ncbi:very short patch repair endonuclease [Microbacterium sp. SORGH_AS_0862]|uniref:very short patch repair endonuclease n=1 Tax=Microbacterium sp. SORGH_AS_0862 TaxID=3041789 RepID=UPI002790F8BF|nr:very short patch repair endonuclease [Microbacterium sp. SORGH_AS_0862]MDQ1203868.1 DNA mismatch endonuclease (patch repair protein) [Microbacterium sp. SORGH_AS_0862]